MLRCMDAYNAGCCGKAANYPDKMRRYDCNSVLWTSKYLRVVNKIPPCIFYKKQKTKFLITQHCTSTEQRRSRKCKVFLSILWLACWLHPYSPLLFHVVFWTFACIHTLCRLCGLKPLCSSADAFMRGLTTGPKQRSGKCQRVMVPT